MIQIIGFKWFKKSVDILALYTCQRWSVLVPFIVYLALFSIVKLASIPLRSQQESVFTQDLVLKQDYEVERKLLKNINGDLTDPYTLLGDIFAKADINKDNLLSPVELAAWINNKTHEHIHQALIENYGLFTTIDVDPRNGVISWDEYHRYFLKVHGYEADVASEHVKKHPELSRNVRESMMRDKAAWSEAARSDPDHLTVDEFLGFRHPESSHTTLLTLVQDLLDKFDRDGDDNLTEDEFSSIQKDEEPEESKIVSPIEAERRKEFRDAIDISKDGKASRHELLMYIDPKNPRHGREEADTLVLLADTNHDGQLDLSEIFKKIDLFLDSKMVDTARSFHDEF